MAITDVIDQMFAAGKDLAARGEGLVQRQLDLPPPGPERDRALQQLGIGALAGGALAVLLGTGAGRRVAGTAATLGGVAALGKIAADAYATWQARQGAGEAAAGAPIVALDGEAAEQRGRLLLRAMLAAARADGHIDSAERARIQRLTMQLGLDDELRLMIDAELARPLDLAELAAGAGDPAAATEVYLASLAVIDLNHPDERAHLDQLAAALGLDPALAAELEARATAG